jgi:DNA-binding MarR family transcriptional regulator
MTDAELAHALERGEIAKENFHHASHLRVAWVCLSESSSLDEAADKIRARLQRFLASAGRSQKYNETITRFWVHLLALAQAAEPGKSLKEILRANPRLLEKYFPFDYYSFKRLFSDKARTSWVSPDLKPLPSMPLRFVHPVHRATRRIGLYLGDLGERRLTQNEAHILALLAHSAPVEVADLHRDFGYKKSSLTAILGGMAYRGFITRERAKSHHRTFQITPTAKGRKVAQRVIRHLSDLERAVMRRVTVADIEGFNNVLAALEQEATNRRRADHS